MEEDFFDAALLNKLAHDRALRILWESKDHIFERVRKKSTKTMYESTNNMAWSIKMMKAIILILSILFFPAESLKGRDRKFFTMKVIAPQFISSPSSRRWQDKMLDQCTLETKQVSGKIMENDLNLYLSEAEWYAYCSGLERKNSVVCDFRPLMKYKTKKLCTEAGGKITPISYSMCNAQMVLGDSKSDKVLRMEYLEFNNFPQCAGWACAEDDLLNIIEDDNTMNGMQCPAKGKYKKFALKVRRNDKVARRSCNWLSTKPNYIKAKICQTRKYQIYIANFLPASRVCPATCEAYQCIQENQTAVFVTTYLQSRPKRIGNTNIGDGEGNSSNEQFYTCQWLSEQPQSVKDYICSQEVIDSEYGEARNVCTATCHTSCLKLPQS